MDWRTTQLDWNHIRTLLVVAESGTYSAAARRLGTTQPTVGRQIAALEHALQVPLVEHVGRSVVLTPAAQELVEHATTMGEAARTLALVASGRSVALEGVVTISASEAVCAWLLPPIIARLRATYPLVHLDLLATSSVSDLRRSEADVAIRHVPPADDELVAVELPPQRGWWYGSPAYLDAIGHPDVGDDLSHVTFLAWDRGPLLGRILGELGVPIGPANTPITCENQLVQWELVRRGQGLGAMMEAIAMADPLVVRALPSLAPIPIPMWIVTHRAVRTSRRVRAVFELLVDEVRRATATP